MFTFLTIDLWLPILIFLVLGISFFILRKHIIDRDLRSRLSNIQDKKERTRIFVSDLEKTGTFNPLSLLRKPFDILREFNKKSIIDFKIRFEQCGWNPQLAPLIIPIIKFLGVVAFILFFSLINANIPEFTSLPFIAKGALFILFIFLGLRSFEYTADAFKYFRYKKIGDGLPMVLDLVMVCTRAGLSLDMSLDRIAQEIAYVMPETAKELTITSAELSILPERRIALDNLAKRVDLPLVHSLAVALTQAEEQGVSIGQTLQLLSQEFSKQKLLDLEAKAGRLPATMTVPMMLCSLPVLFIIILGPGVTQMISSGFLEHLKK
jgi:tight adherence protein C